MKYSLVNGHSKPQNKIVKTEYCMFLKNGKKNYYNIQSFSGDTWNLSVETFHSSSLGWFYTLSGVCLWQILLSKRQSLSKGLGNKILCTDGTKIKLLGLNSKHFFGGKQGFITCSIPSLLVPVVVVLLESWKEQSTLNENLIQRAQTGLQVYLPRKRRP